MHTQNFQISPIQKNIQVKCNNNFQKCVQVGENLDCALFIGLIEYHIKVNKVEEVKKIYAKCQDSRVEQFKTTISNSENQPQPFEYILKQLQLYEEMLKCFTKLIETYFKVNSIQNEKDQQKDLQNKTRLLEKDFKIKFQVCDVKANQQIYNIESQTIYLFKYDSNYYLLINALDDQKQCSKCRKKSHLQIINCSHSLCFFCIQNEFESQNKTIFNCFVKGCQNQITKSQFLKMKAPKQQNQIKQNDYCIKCQVNKVEIKQELCNDCQKLQKNINKDQLVQSNTKKKEVQQEKVIQQQQSIKTEKRSNESQTQSNKQTEQIEQPIQNEKPNNLEKSNKNDENNIQKNGKQINQFQNFNEEDEIKQKQIQTQIKRCSHCQKECTNEVCEAKCGHSYCIKCFHILQQQKNQYTCLHPKCKQIIQIDNYEDNKQCGKCQQIKDNQTLFTNFCGHQICTQCLEGLIKNKKILKCPSCNLQLKDVEVFFQHLQNQNIEKDLKNSNQQDIYGLLSNQTLQQSSNTKFCTFCQSPFTDYNLQQLLSHCQNPSHMIGVCCTIFPLDCPQCQLSSLEISKYQITFVISQNLDQNTLLI